MYQYGLRGFLALALVAAATSAHAQASVFDFTGTVTSSDFGSIAIGTNITGTYTIDLANADLSNNGFSDGTIGDIAWILGEAGGIGVNDLPAPTTSVFSATYNIGGLMFDMPAPSAIGSASSVHGGNFFYSGGYDVFTSNTTYVATGLLIVDLREMPEAPFTSDGLPVLSTNTVATGMLTFGTNVPNAPALSYASRLDYSITSLTPAKAPEIDPASAASGLALLLGGLAVLRGSRGEDRSLAMATKKKITKAEREVQTQMLGMLEYASKRPDRWYDIGNLEATKKAAELLEKRGVIEIWREINRYRLKPQR